jgi:hypothetical protein
MVRGHRQRGGGVLNGEPNGGCREEEFSTAAGRKSS